MKKNTLSVSKMLVLSLFALLALSCFDHALATDVDYNTNITTTVDNGGAAYRFGVSVSNLTMTISGGGILTNVSTGVIGVNATATNNSVTVTGTGSAWYMTNTLTVGSSGSGNILIITNGAKVFARGTVSTAIGTTGTKYNTAIVTGAGSMLTNAGTGDLDIGYNGGDSNTLIIADGGQVFSSGVNSWPGRTSISYGSATAKGNKAIVTDPGSKWTYGPGAGADGFVTGGSGSLLIVSNQGTLVSSGISVGHQGGDTTIIVTGTGSLWNAGTINWNGGTGQTIIATSGGKVSAGSVSSRSGGGLGMSFISDGTNSLIYSSGSLYLGSAGPGDKLTITNGGAISCSDGRLGWGNAAYTNNIAVITDPGSVWTNSTLLVGDSAGLNRMVIRNGGKVICTTSCSIGNASGINSNSVTVTNSGILQVNGALTLGNASSVSNELNLCNGGIVTNVTTFTINSNNTLNLYGGTMTMTTLVMNAGAQMGIDAMVTNMVAVSGNVTLNGYLNPSTNLPKVSKIICTVLTYGGSQLGPGLTIGPMPEGFSGMTYTNTGSPSELMLKIIGPPGGMVITVR